MTTAPRSRAGAPHRSASPHQRPLHPGAVWAWAALGAVAILRTNNPLVLAIEMTMIALVVEHRSPAQGRWRRTFQALVIAAAAITIARLAVAALIPPPAVPPLVWDIPAWEPITGFRIGGPLSWATVVVGLYDSFRLTVTVAIFGAAGSMSSPAAALRSLPATVYEIGIAVAVGLAVAPMGASTLVRQRKMRRMRGRAVGGPRGWVGLATPVLDETLDRALGIASSLDSRGYGRRSSDADRSRAVSSLAVAGMWLGLGVIGWATYRIGAGDVGGLMAQPLIKWSTLGAGALMTIWCIRLRRVTAGRTRYIPRAQSNDKPGWPIAGWHRGEWTAVVGAVLCLVATLAASQLSPTSMDLTTDPLVVPPLPLVAVVGALGLATPMLGRTNPQRPPALAPMSPVLDATAARRWRLS